MGIAPQLGEALYQIIDFVFGQRQTQFDVGLFQRSATAAEHIHGRQRLGLRMAEQWRSLFQRAQYQLGHAVMQTGGNGARLGLAQLATDVIGNTALQALDLGQTAVARDIAGLARPGRNGAKARHHQKQTPRRLLHRHARTVLEQARQHLLLFGQELPGHIGEVGKLGVQPGNARGNLGQLVEQFAVTEGGKGGSAAQDEHCQNSLWRR